MSFMSSIETSSVRAPQGIPVGEPAPAATLTDLEGESFELADYRGAPTAVLFWNPGCGFCQQMLDDLKAWEKKPPKRAPRLLVVSTGSAETNREMGLRSPLGLEEGFQLGRAFGALGTPSAVLLDADGNIASSIAVGADAVLALLRTTQMPREAALA
jgi:thiol-disulfide isomerase/thioredoxin